MNYFQTVRFAPEVEKDENNKATTSTAAATTTATTTPSLVSVSTPVTSVASTSADVSTDSSSASTSTLVKVPLDVSTSGTTESGDALMNHSKIISEVLRKFPDLVKDNKNIKLKIVQRAMDSTSAGTSSKETKSKVSYIVLKSTSSGDSTASTVLKKSPAQSSVSKFWETDKTPKKPSPAENTTGPWLCETCGEGENSALQFETYYSFRRHLVVSVIL